MQNIRKFYIDLNEFNSIVWNQIDYIDFENSDKEINKE